MFINYIAD